MSEAPEAPEASPLPSPSPQEAPTQNEQAPSSKEIIVDSTKDIPLEAEETPPKNHEVLNMIRGDIEAIKTYSLIRISVSDPQIADIANVETDQILMLAKRSGQTTLFLWDQYGKRAILIRVADEDLNVLKQRVEKLLEDTGLKEGLSVDVSEYEGKVVISGDLSAEKREKLDIVLQPLAGNILNLVQEELMEDLVQVDVEIAELNTSLAKSLGIEWPSALTYTESPGSFVANAPRDIFKVGPLSRTTQILATVRALITEGKGRVLSKPKLVVVSGKEASFLVGGEIPVTTTTTSAGGNVTQNVQFKNFGVSLTITPTIKKGDKVDVLMNIAVSDVDEAHAVGENVAFSTRTAQTQLLLNDGQTVVLAGLIKHNEGESVSKVPFLGDIPLVGALFRWRRNPTANTETELVITLTPTILREDQEEQPAVAKKTDVSSEPSPKKDEAKMASGDSGGPPADQGEDRRAGVDSPIPPAGAPAADSHSESAAASSPGESPSAEKLTRDTAPENSDSKQVSPEGLTPLPQAESLSAVPGLDSYHKMQDDLINAYVKSIQKRISKQIAYPFEAREKGWEGTVKLTLRLLKDGSLAEVAVKESSGYTIFDKDAVNTARILAPYESFPSELKLNELMIIAPIVYSQKALGQQGEAPVCDVNTEALAAGHPNPFLPGGVTYSELIQKRIAHAIIYPEEARQYGWEGTVKIALHILSDGTLAYAAVKESSGYELFDQCALQTAKNLAPYSNFPSDSQLQELNVTVPIVYSLEK